MSIAFSNRNKFFLSLVSGLAVSLGVGIYLKREREKIAEHYVMATVLRSKKYIAAGKSLTPDLVEETQIPVAYLPPAALQKKTDLQEAKGDMRYKARIGVMKGELVTKSKLLEASTLLGLAWTLQPGQTALTLKCGLEEGVAGLVQPGDWVNVIVSFGGKANLLLYRVRVAAVGDRVWDPATFLPQGEISKAVASDPILVTLVVTPRQSLKVALAAEKGKVTLALSSPLESEPNLTESPVGTEELLKPGG